MTISITLYSRGYGPVSVNVDNLSAYDFFGYVPDDELMANMRSVSVHGRTWYVDHAGLRRRHRPDLHHRKNVNSSIYRISTYSIVIDRMLPQNNTFNDCDDSMSFRGPVIIPGLPLFESDRLEFPINDTTFDLQRR